MRRPFGIKVNNKDGNDDYMMMLITRIHPKLRSVGRCVHWKAKDEWSHHVRRNLSLNLEKFWCRLTDSHKCIWVCSYACRRTKKRTPKNWEQGKVKCLHLESKITAMAMLVGELNQCLFPWVRYTYGWKAEKSQSYWRVIHVIDEVHFISGERQISIFWMMIF